MTSVAKISRVLVGVDLDEASASALKMVGAIATAWNPEITLSHATKLDVPAYFTGAQIVALEIERERSRTAIAARTDGGNGAAADAWVDVLRRAFGGNVVRSMDIHQCSPNRFEKTDLIVLPMPADGDAPLRFAAIVNVLEECVHPVLFVPSADGIFERSSS